MNDAALDASSGTRAALGGLPLRLVRDGILDEAAMTEALATAREYEQQRTAEALDGFFRRLT